MNLKIASYNVRHCAEGIDAVADVLRSLGADVVGMQEVDRNNERSPMDQPALLAAAADYPYYCYTPAIDYKGGEYGTLILSRYPVEAFTVTKLSSGEKEGRAVGHAVIRAGKETVDFFNTHLSFEARELRDVQYAELAAMMASCPNAVLTGDFNTEDFSEFAPLLGGKKLVNNAEHRLVTFPKYATAIDNIVLPERWRIKTAQTVTEAHSDHFLLWAEAETVF